METSHERVGSPERFTSHWFTDGASIVILAKKWAYGDHSGYTPHARFVTTDQRIAVPNEPHERSELIDSEQIAKMLDSGELKYIGTTCAAP